MYNGPAVLQNIVVAGASDKRTKEHVLLKAWLVRSTVVLQVYNQIRQTSTWRELRTREQVEDICLELEVSAKAKAALFKNLPRESADDAVQDNDQR